LRSISFLIWSLAAVGFIAASLVFLGILLPEVWLSELGMISASISLLGLVVFWRTWPIFNTIGALRVDVAVLITQLWLGWQS